MSSVISEKIQSYTFTSDPNNGAQSVSSDGSRFSVNLDSPISIPQGVIDCNIDVIAASIWNVSPNISPLFQNNLFYFQYQTINYLITIQEGLYSLTQLNGYISRYFVNNGLPKNLIVFSGDAATQSTVITFNYITTQIDFTQADTIRTILGFDSSLVPTLPSTIIGESYISDTQAKFNRINFFYIKSSLVTEGLPINGVAGNIISQIPITSAPGSQINYSPQNVISIEARNLIGKTIQQIRFQLLDDQLRPVNTLGEYWSVTLHIHSQLLLSTLTLPLIP